jgi:hypothetical protein
MTVSELITELQKHPPDMLLYVNGYEGNGCDDLAKLLPVMVTRGGGLKGFYGGWYYGEHMDREPYGNQVPNGLLIK